VPLPGHPVPGPDRDRPHPVGDAMEAAINAFSITFGDRSRSSRPTNPDARKALGETDPDTGPRKSEEGP
jgi:hypothetical protein